MDEHTHTEAIKFVCRVCGGPAKQHRPCIDHQQSLKATFNLDITNDHEHIHPKLVCKRCFAIVLRHKKASEEGRPYFHSVEPVKWSKHSDGGCKI